MGALLGEQPIRDTDRFLISGLTGGWSTPTVDIDPFVLFGRNVQVFRSPAHLVQLFHIELFLVLFLRVRLFGFFFLHFRPP